MAHEEGRPRSRCFLAIPSSSGFDRIKDAIIKGAQETDFQIVFPDVKPFPPGTTREMLVGELARADCVIADLTSSDPTVLYESGLARAMGKGLILLAQKDSLQDVPVDLREFMCLVYDSSPSGLSKLAKDIRQALQGIRRFPRSAILNPRRFPTPFFVDWDGLDRADADNLYRELLAQMGFQRLDWSKESREFDLIAELPKKDPDGFEYRELWLIAMGRNAPLEKLLQMASGEPEYILHRWTKRLRRSCVWGGGRSWA